MTRYGTLVRKNALDKKKQILQDMKSRGPCCDDSTEILLSHTPRLQFSKDEFAIRKHRCLNCGTTRYSIEE